jgi:hypothetical protein
VSAHKKAKLGCDAKGPQSGGLRYIGENLRPEVEGWVMGERYFEVERAARILECTPRTVQRMIADGWLNGPPASRMNCESARVSEKSLFQLMIIERLSRLPIRTLREFKNRRKNFVRMLRQIAKPKRFSSIEGAVEAVENTSSRSNELAGGTPATHRLHEKVAVERQFSFGWLARQLAPGDPSLQDDLVQEMSLAVLEYEKPANFEYLFELAKNRAIDFLRYEGRRGMISLREARQESDTFATKMNSLQNLIQKLTYRGVPLEWIEEVLGERLDVA